jgi:hypothetical protein
MAAQGGAEGEGERGDQATPVLEIFSHKKRGKGEKCMDAIMYMHLFF